MASADLLSAIFDAERALRQAERELLKADDIELEELLIGAVAEAKELDIELEQSLRLERLADLCAQIPGPRMADALIQILDCESPNIRVAAAEALRDVAFERYAEVARAAERHLDKGDEGPAMGELPWVIVEVAEPSAVALVGKFLALRDPAIVASALEALASLGDPRAIPLVEPLMEDTRSVPLDDYDGEVTETLGNLATEVVGALEAIEGPLDGDDDLDDLDDDDEPDA